MLILATIRNVQKNAEIQGLNSINRMLYEKPSKLVNTKDDLICCEICTKRVEN